MQQHTCQSEPLTEMIMPVLINDTPVKRKPVKSLLDLFTTRDICAFLCKQLGYNCMKSCVVWEELDSVTSRLDFGDDDGFRILLSSCKQLRALDIHRLEWLLFDFASPLLDEVEIDFVGNEYPAYYNLVTKALVSLIAFCWALTPTQYALDDIIKPGTPLSYLVSGLIERAKAGAKDPYSVLNKIRTAYDEVMVMHTGRRKPVGWMPSEILLPLIVHGYDDDEVRYTIRNGIVMSRQYNEQYEEGDKEIDGDLKNIAPDLQRNREIVYQALDLDFACVRYPESMLVQDCRFWGGTFKDRME